MHRNNNKKYAPAVESLLDVSIVFASKTNANDVFSHLVIVQEEIDHVEQQA